MRCSTILLDLAFIAVFLLDGLPGGEAGKHQGERGKFPLTAGAVGFWGFVSLFLMVGTALVCKVLRAVL